MADDKLTLKQLLQNLSVAEFWSLLGVIVALLGGAFTLGYKINDFSSVKKIEDCERELKVAQADVPETRRANTFLALYLRYQLAKEATASSSKTSEDEKDLKVAKDGFDAWLMEQVGKEKLILHKGQKRLATIQFADGTIWTIPRELHMVEAR